MTLLADLLDKVWSIVLLGLGALGWLVLAPFRLIRFLWRKITPEGARKVRDLSIIVVLLISIYNVRLQRQNSAVNRKVFLGYQEVLQRIEAQTSPEAQERQRNLINFIIDRVDCRNQASLQRTIDVLVERNILEPGDVRAITKACEELILREAEDSPTTTLPSGD